MARTRQASHRGFRLSQTIPRYRGYSSAKAAHVSDQAFSEEVLSGLGDAAAAISRLRRNASGTADPEVIAKLEAMEANMEVMAGHLAAGLPKQDVLLRLKEEGRAEELESLDAAVVEKMGHVKQALSVMDLEGGVGIDAEDLESVCELVDDLGDYIKQRAILIGG
jgi:hypothetical protein